jgi:hypothetical protein
MAFLSIVAGIAEAFLEQCDVRQVVQQLAVALVPDQAFRIRPGIWPPLGGSRYRLACRVVGNPDNPLLLDRAAINKPTVYQLGHLFVGR